MSDSPVVYIAPKGFEAELLEELGLLKISVLEQRGRLFLARREGGIHTQLPAWAQNIWLAPQFILATSISQAAKALKSIQRNWVCHPTIHYRRAALIQEKLPKFSHASFEFGKPQTSISPLRQLGSWTLWDENTLLASPICSSHFADGEVYFQENKTDPPGRAYLKLWELLTLYEIYPEPGELCIDLGSSPGGWTWVLASLGAKVISVDKAPLAKNVAAMPNVTYVQGSAFGLNPADFGGLSWLCSDVICYPERLYKLIMQWLQAGFTGNVICTLKFQGTTDFKSIELFRSIPGGRLTHLFHNKHELTWIRLAN